MKLRFWVVLVGIVSVGAACSSGPSATTHVPASTSTTTATVTTSTVVTTLTTTTMSTTLGGVPTVPFSVPVGDNGVTYDLAGEPSSGPTSFVVLEDGSVVIADTMAVRFGEPRLLRFDAAGARLDPIVLTLAEVASIVDVASDGQKIAVLDVYPAMDRYRVLVLDASGDVETIYDVPNGFHLEDGLTGLAWDDSGVLLEMEWGARYARVASGGPFESTRTVVFDGTPITITPGAGLTTVVEVGPASFDVVRNVEMGGASLIGLAPDGSILLVIDEVGMSDEGGIEVTRRVQRYTPTGDLTGEVSFLVRQFVGIARTLEATADGRVAHLVTLEDRVEIRILDL
ncbi:MAG: hypothetical protein V1912_05195 [bacterium]